jgi:hypothetical protein
MRHHKAAPTETMHMTPSAITQCSPASVPMPKVWATATGHDPYANQWIARHVPGFTRDRSRLETKTANMRSSATVPIPTQNLL